MVSIKKNGRHVANSPISIMVVQSEIGDASRVKVFGPGLVEGRTFQMADFIVDTRDAGEMLVILSSWYGFWGIVIGMKNGACAFSIF